jgi:hypothetical protein
MVGSALLGFVVEAGVPVGRTAAGRPADPPEDGVVRTMPMTASPVTPRRTKAATR